VELNGLVPIIRRWLGVILVATAVATGIGLLLGASAEKTYEARAEMLVGPLSTDTDTMRASGDLAQTYAQLATTNSVLSTAARDLDLPVGQLRTGVRATANSTTRFLVVRARSHNAEDAADIANSISLQLLELGKSDPSRPEGQIRVIDPARPPSTPVSPRLDLIVPLAALAGLLGSLTLVLLFEFVGDTAESIEKVDALTGVPTLAVKQRRRERGGADDASGDLEPYRIIATQVDLAAPHVGCVLITGVTEGDGTDSIARRLAAVWARRRPSVTLLDLGTGEVTQLSGPSRPVRQVLAGRGGDPESMTIAEAKSIRDQITDGGGVLVILGQPATSSAATLVWARVADVTVLSVRRFQARRSMISDAVTNLEAVDANLALSVLHERPGTGRRSRSGREPSSPSGRAGDPDDMTVPPMVAGLDGSLLEDELIAATAADERSGGGPGAEAGRRRREGSATTGSGTRR